MTGGEAVLVAAVASGLAVVVGLSHGAVRARHAAVQRRIRGDLVGAAWWDGVWRRANRATWAALWATYVGMVAGLVIVAQ